MARIENIFYFPEDQQKTFSFSSDSIKTSIFNATRAKKRVETSKYVLYRPLIGTLFNSETPLFSSAECWCTETLRSTVSKHIFIKLADIDRSLGQDLTSILFDAVKFVVPFAILNDYFDWALIQELINRFQIFRNF